MSLIYFLMQKNWGTRISRFKFAERNPQLSNLWDKCTANCTSFIGTIVGNHDLILLLDLSKEDYWTNTTPMRHESDLHTMDW